MIPKFSEEFAWWIVEHLLNEGYIERRIEHYGAYGREDLYSDESIQKEIRRILMESERERDEQEDRSNQNI